MKIEDALRRCCVLAHAGVCKNVPSHINMHLIFGFDASTEEGALIRDWFNDLEPFLPIEA